MSHEVDMSIEKLRKTLEELRLLDRSKKKGCTEEEIRILEAKYNIKLPDSYKSFLMGYGHGGSNIVMIKNLSTNTMLC